MAWTCGWVVCGHQKVGWGIDDEYDYIGQVQAGDRQIDQAYNEETDALLGVSNLGQWAPTAECQQH